MDSQKQVIVADLQFGHNSPVISLHVLPNGENFVTSGENGQLLVFDLLPIRPRPRLSTTLPTQSNRVRFLSLVDRVYVGTLRGIEIFDWGQGRVDELFSRPCQLTALDTAVKTDLVASGWEDGNIILFHSEKPSDRKSFTAAKRGVFALCFDKTGQMILAGGADGAVRLWDAERMGLIFEADVHPTKVTAVAFAPDGITFASASADGTIKAWNWHDQTQEADFQVGAPICSLSYSPDGLHLAGGLGGPLDRSLCVWNALELGSDSSDNIYMMNCHNPVRAVQFTPDGRLVCNTHNFPIESFNFSLADKRKDRPGEIANASSTIIMPTLS